MKYAIISDVHGNAPTLRLALDDARREGAEGFLFAGDYCISAPWGDDVLSRLRDLPHAHAICGNDDLHLDVPDGDDGQYEVSRWCAASISPENRAWLDALPRELTLTSEGVTIRMAHSSEAFVGKHIHDRFRPTVMAQRHPAGVLPREQLLQDFRSLWEDASFREDIGHLEKGVYIFGHNHIQAWGDFDGRILIDPGSCGLPLDCAEFCAAYTLLTIQDGCMTVEERRIPYDAESLIAQVRTTGQYQAARVWSETIFREWRTRREQVCFLLQHAEEYARRIGDARRPFAKDTWEAAYHDWRQRFPKE